MNIDPEINLTLLTAFTKQAYARAEFLKGEQKKSTHYSENKIVYARLLVDACKYYLSEIEVKKYDPRDINGMKKGTSLLPLFHYSNGMLTGHFGEDDISALLDDIHTAFLEGITDTKTSLQDIFLKEIYYKKCLEILNHFEVAKLSTRQGYTLFAVIAAIKEKTQPSLLNKNYTDKELLQIFNNYAGKNFAQIKKDSPGFDSVKDEVKKMLSSL